MADDVIEGSGDRDQSGASKSHLTLYIGIGLVGAVILALAAPRVAMGF